jgi:hypothetical protein
MVVELPADEVAVVAAMLGHPAPTAWRVEEVGYESGSPATGALLRVTGGGGDAAPWSVFVKLLAHLRHWPRLHLLPAEIREVFAAEFPWRQELAAWEEPFAGALPAGLRLPALYRITELGDDRLLVWMEDIDALDATAWDVERFARAGRVLGGLAALRGTPEAIAGAAMPAGGGLRKYVDNRVIRWAVPRLLDDRTWRHPLVAGAVDAGLRTDLRWLAGELPGILDRLDALPQALPHGDASPQNLLVPKDAPDGFVAIDISFQCPMAVGFDLGQLLVGLAHAGQLPVEALPAIHRVLVPAFAAGIQQYGATVDPADVGYGYVGSLVARAALTSLPLELLDGPGAGDPTEELVDLFRQRAALSRFLVDLGLELPHSPSSWRSGSTGTLDPRK